MSNQIDDSKPWERYGLTALEYDLYKHSIDYLNCSLSKSENMWVMCTDYNGFLTTYEYQHLTEIFDVAREHYWDWKESNPTE